jgi:hypothetical protein
MSVLMFTCCVVTRAAVFSQDGQKYMDYKMVLDLAGSLDS